MYQYVRISDATEIRQFVRELQGALKKSKQNGGGFSCFLHNTQGEVILQLEVALSIESLVR